MATEQDHVWAMLDDMLVFLAKRHVPTPERTYKLDGGWTLAMDDLRGFVDRLIAERDALAALVVALRERVAELEGAEELNTPDGGLDKVIRVGRTYFRDLRHDRDQLRAERDAALADAARLRAVGGAK